MIPGFHNKDCFQFLYAVFSIIFCNISELLYSILINSI